MAFNDAMLIGLGIIAGIYIFYRLLFTKSKFEDDYERLYNKVLTSEEYKVKGQYDK